MKTELEATPSSEQGEWRYDFVVITGRHKIIDRHAGCQIATADDEDSARTIVRALNAAPAPYEACRDALEDVTGPITLSGIKIRYSTRDKLTAALALADGPQNQETK